jgi:histidine ammonia-lyase
MFSDIRERVAFLEEDRYLASDIETMQRWVMHTEWPETIQNLLPSAQS